MNLNIKYEFHNQFILKVIEKTLKENFENYYFKYKKVFFEHFKDYNNLMSENYKDISGYTFDNELKCFYSMYLEAYKSPKVNQEIESLYIKDLNERIKNEKDILLIKKVKFNIDFDSERFKKEIVSIKLFTNYQFNYFTMILYIYYLKDKRYDFLNKQRISLLNFPLKIDLENDVIMMIDKDNERLIESINKEFLDEINLKVTEKRLKSTLKLFSRRYKSIYDEVDIMRINITSFNFMAYINYFETFLIIK